MTDDKAPAGTPTPVRPGDRGSRARLLASYPSDLPGLLIEAATAILPPTPTGVVAMRLFGAPTDIEPIMAALAGRIVGDPEQITLGDTGLIIVNARLDAEPV